MIDGFRLELPDGGNSISPSLVFEATSVGVTHNTDLTALGGGSSAIAVLSDLAGVEDVQAEGKRQSARLDLGAGLHITELDFSSYEGSSDRWGAPDGNGGPWDATGDEPRAQLQTLDNALRLTTIDSRNPATLKVGKYSGQSGEFDPLEVAPLESPLTFDNEVNASRFTGRLRFIDIASVTGALDAAKEKT